MRHALADGVLVRAGKGREHEIARVRVPFVYGQLVDLLDGRADARHVAEVEFRIHALGKEVHRDRDDVAVAGALAVAEERAFDTLRAGHERKFGGRDPGTAVVVRVQADDDAVARRELAAEPLDLVRIDVRGRHLYGRGQVDDHLLVRRRAPLFDHRRADIHREFELRTREALRGVLEDDVRARQRRKAVAHDPCALHGEIDDALPSHPEHHPTLQLRGRVVEMEDDVGRAFKGLHRAADQLLACLAEHLDSDVRRNPALAHDASDKVEVRLRRRREADLDLLQSHVEQEIPHPELLGDVHRVDERLVAVPEVHAAPARRPIEHRVRPRAFRQVDGLEGAVLLVGHGAGAGARGTHGKRRVRWRFRWLRSHDKPLDSRLITVLKPGSSGREPLLER